MCAALHVAPLLIPFPASCGPAGPDLVVRATPSHPPFLRWPILPPPFLQAGPLGPLGLYHSLGFYAVSTTLDLTSAAPLSPRRFKLAKAGAAAPHCAALTGTPLRDCPREERIGG